jgi:hypothetical protein
VFTKDDNAIGKGVVGFYKYLCTKYVGVTRETVSDFLATKDQYQMTQNMSKRVNKPIISKYPNQIWGVDLIDNNDIVSSNRGWRYIMTMVDIFSRKVFLTKLKTKDAIQTREALKEVIDANTKPKYVLSDNGLEWGGDFASYCKENDIKQLYARSYSPESNGIVERANKEIRKIIRAFFVRNNNKIWYTILNKIQDNKNNSFNESVKQMPQNIYDTTNKEVKVKSEVFASTPKQKARIAIIKKTIQQIKKFNQQNRYYLFDKVRVKMSSIFSNVRRLMKEGNSKQVAVTFTPEMFLVSRVIVPRNNVLERRRYILINADDKPLSKNGKPQMFYSSELLLVGGDNDNDADISMEEALKLNGVKPSSTDVDY